MSDGLPGDDVKVEAPTNAELLSLVRTFYDATVNDDSTYCFGCGCIDAERLRSRWIHQPIRLAELEKELSVLSPRFWTHKPDCMIYQARKLLGQ